MAKSLKVIIFLASAICLLSLLGIVNADPTFNVEGKVYCDTCRAQFLTRVSKFMKGAKVRLECRNREGGDLTYSVEGETDANGGYRLTATGDHEEEVCEVVLVKSSMPECSEESTAEYLRKTARISLTTNNGISSPVRDANPLGYMVKEPIPECTEALRELGITSDGLV
ncbi:Olee1-like protein [Tripterygium wilfordii]|uniref:Olee1-like protein n=1 Tax=Tripterygium wilfordii TaxID=458696 RepID=A0A7J7D7Q8_TRIWF|nr:olee1-like protein [Tripterygium wilfordii]XP_038709991.1 olee1-like protein [Tripterygium wilfordii]KAF5742341.1 Olee1-like protein [Tripterygium wilfordii]